MSATILAHNDAITISTIAEAVAVGLPTASHLVEQLVRRGLVVRTEDAKDRRHTLALLTPQGEELIGQLHRDHREQLRSWLAQLNQDELNALWSGLQPLRCIADGSWHSVKQEGGDTTTRIDKTVSNVQIEKQGEHA